MKDNTKQQIAFLYIWLIGGSAALILLYTGLIKLLDMEQWIRKYNKIDYVHIFHLEWFAYLLPLLELIVSILFLSDKLRKYSFIGSFCLFALFTLYIIQKIYISNDSTCACGGIFEKLTLDKHLYINLFYCITIPVAYFLDKNRSNTDQKDIPVHSIS